MLGHSLHHRNELHESAANFLEKTVDLKWIARVLLMDNGKRVELHRVLLQETDTAHDLMKTRLATFTYAITVVELLWSIHRETDQEAIFGQKLTPSIIEECSIRLQSILDPFSPSVLILEFYDAAEVVDAQERGFAALPGKGNYFSSLTLYILPDVELQNFVRHPPAAIFLT